MKMSNIRIGRITLVVVVLGTLVFIYLGYRSAYSSVIENSDKLAKFYEKDSKAALLINAILVNKIKNNAFVMLPDDSEEKNDVVIIKTGNSPLNFKDAKSNKDMITLLIEFIAKKDYENTEFAIKKKPEAMSDMKSPFMYGFFTFFGCFQKSYYDADKKIYEMMVRFWDKKDKTQFVFGIIDDKTIFIGIYDNEKKSIEEYRIIGNLEHELKKGKQDGAIKSLDEKIKHTPLPLVVRHDPDF